MLKKTIKYVDYDGNEREETHYFNLTRAEILDMEATTPGGMTGFIKKIAAEKDNVKLYEMFKDLIHKSYGVKSPDGRQFVKSEELFNSFAQSEAYSELIMSFVENADNITEFIEGILPTPKQ